MRPVQSVAGVQAVRSDDKISYHSRRAKTELEMARSAGNAPAAQAHLSLAALHIEQVRALGGEPLPPADLI